ncbi:deoxycytidylate deaminase [candidate division WWE3 bacterium]|nr:deoxycytidylate deaminase [candidate division WWE3 bacterium]
MKVIVAYIPILHRGYIDLLKCHADADQLCIISQELIDQFDYLAKEIRSLTPHMIADALRVIGIIPSVRVIDEDGLRELAMQASLIVMPDEDVCHQLAHQYFKRNQTIYSAIFLRWDKRRTVTEQEVIPDQVITAEACHVELLGRAQKAAHQSSDWWRQVGAVLVSPRGQILITGFNRHLPHPLTPYSDGDPRNALYKAVHVDLTTAIHAEAYVIAMAARDGFRTKGSHLYVSTFPCPACAKLIGCSGIRTMYYADGYAMLDGQTILKHFGVRIVHVIVPNSME